MQSWVVDIWACTAMPYIGTRKRLVAKRNKRLDVRPLAEAIVKSIVQQKLDDRMHWNDDRTKVMIFPGRMMPESYVPKQTIARRRKRFRKLVIELLEPPGWVPGRKAHVYERVSEKVP